MSDFGLDRQFRGEIRNLQIFGSRISSRGVLRIEEVRKKNAMNLEPTRSFLLSYLNLWLIAKPTQTGT